MRGGGGREEAARPCRSRSVDGGCTSISPKGPDPRFDLPRLSEAACRTHTQTPSVGESSFPPSFVALALAELLPSVRRLFFEGRRRGAVARRYPPQARRERPDIWWRDRQPQIATRGSSPSTRCSVSRSACASRGALDRESASTARPFVHESPRVRRSPGVRKARAEAPHGDGERPPASAVRRHAPGDALSAERYVATPVCVCACAPPVALRPIVSVAARAVHHGVRDAHAVGLPACSPASRAAGARVSRVVVRVRAKFGDTVGIR